MQSTVQHSWIDASHITDCQLVKGEYSKIHFEVLVKYLELNHSVTLWEQTGGRCFVKTVSWRQGHSKIVPVKAGTALKEPFNYGDLMIYLLAASSGHMLCFLISLSSDFYPHMHKKWGRIILHNFIHCTPEQSVCGLWEVAVCFHDKDRVKCIDSLQGIQGVNEECVVLQVDWRLRPVQ